MYMWYLVYKNGYSEVVSADNLAELYYKLNNADLVTAIKLDIDKIKQVTDALSTNHYVN